MQSTLVLNRPTLSQPARAGAVVHPSRQVTLMADVAGALRCFAVFLGGLAALVTPLLLFRLWSQLMASIPTSAPGSWLYSASGAIVSPFSGFETARAATGSGVGLEFSLLVALEFFLLTAVLAGAILFIVRVFSNNLMFSIWMRAFEVGPQLAAFDTADAWAHRSMERGANAAMAGIQYTARRIAAVDWHGIGTEMQRESASFARSARSARTRYLVH